MVHRVVIASDEMLQQLPASLVAVPACHVVVAGVRAALAYADTVHHRAGLLLRDDTLYVQQLAVCGNP